MLAFAISALFLGLVYWCFTHTLTEEECAEELDAWVVERLGGS
jgi:hypothetical protein